MSRETPTSVTARLRGWDQGHWADWAVPAVVAALWALVLAGSADVGLATRRGLVFVGGPVLLLSGLHARITGYLHAASRAQLLVLPIDPRAHFAAARRRHRRGLGWTLLLGSVAVLAGLVPAVGWSDAWGLVLDWAALAVVGGLLEPLIPAVSAAAGRRFTSDSWQDELQRRAGGGWTLPETVIHLYAPALGIGVAAALAMPLQIGVDLHVDGTAVPFGLWIAGGVGVVLAGLGGFVAPSIYARGVFESAAFLSEASRTLAGPPIPEPTPPTIERLRDPVLRLLVLSLWRETPVPMLRLLAVVGGAALVSLSAVPGPAHLAVWLATCVLWMVPATVVLRGRALRARLLSTLPLPPLQRKGRHRWASPLLFSPVVGTAAVVVPRALGLW